MVSPTLFALPILLPVAPTFGGPTAGRAFTTTIDMPSITMPTNEELFLTFRAGSPSKNFPTSRNFHPGLQKKLDIHPSNRDAFKVE